MIPPKIKVCGITSVSDAVASVMAGVNALGLIFYPKSPRYLTIEIASEIARQVPPFTCLVGVFINATKPDIAAVLKQVPLGLLQFHGNESEADCRSWGIPYIKAFRVKPTSRITEMVTPFHSASGYLLDSYHPKIEGGVGKPFDWNLIPDKLDKPIILAGGLNPDNISEALAVVQPYAVDVSSGVELTYGVKDLDKIHAFVQSIGNFCSKIGNSW
ncbi:MAG: phosphoribosylanthranilate isomerase [Endozoicomonas sp. (ex Botrylloides leachii)]|nr:phosphoribosylanthranilate isomerase [Endozoicomonas sp. (ex Botrylloides leachii)]